MTSSKSFIVFRLWSSRNKKGKLCSSSETGRTNSSFILLKLNRITKNFYIHSNQVKVPTSSFTTTGSPWDARKSIRTMNPPSGKSGFAFITSFSTGLAGFSTLFQTRWSMYLEPQKNPALNWFSTLAITVSISDFLLRNSRKPYKKLAGNLTKNSSGFNPSKLRNTSQSTKALFLRRWFKSPKQSKNIFSNNCGK